MLAWMEYSLAVRTVAQPVVLHVKKWRRSDHEAALSIHEVQHQTHPPCFRGVRGQSGRSGPVHWYSYAARCGAMHTLYCNQGSYFRSSPPLSPFGRSSVPCMRLSFCALPPASSALELVVPSWASPSDRPPPILPVRRSRSRVKATSGECCELSKIRVCRLPRQCMT